MTPLFAFTLLALLLTSAIAAEHQGVNSYDALHQMMEKRVAEYGVNGQNATCGCYPSVSTWYGAATLIQPATVASTTTRTSTSYSTVTVYATDDAAPTPYISYSSTGVYTVQAHTVVVTQTVVVPCATKSSSSQTFAPGTYTRSETTNTVTDTRATFAYSYVTVSPVPATVPAPEHTSNAPPAASSVEASPAPSEPAPVSVQPISAPVVSAPAPAEPASAPAVSAPVPAPPANTPLNADPTPSGSGPILNGKQWAMTYSPYQAAGGCKDASAVSHDISQIKQAGWTTVRIYSTDCGGLENVGNACRQHGLKLILGIFVDKMGIDNARPQITDMINWGQWDLVQLVVVGNECQLGKFCTADEMVNFIGESKGQLRGAGYNGPVTTAETLNIWQESGSKLCGVIDVIGINIHPFFNSEVAPADAGKFTAGQLELVRQICPGKAAYNLECGWPHSGEPNGKATPGYDHQRTAMMSIMEAVGEFTAAFTFEDDGWKQPGAFGVEQNWGCNKLFLPS